jgi:hypothetical protein
MVRRFQIEDLMTQDASGVVFRALDTETGLPVAVRRFFPFGVNGGGLSEEEQADYNIAVEQLTGISHPAMRSIIAGGCDPVDGMPFIATEWVEGTPLQTFLERGPLAPAEAAHVLTLAIDVCGQISQALGEESVWIETDVHTIIVGAEESGRGITFWISPLKWLGKSDGQRGLSSLAGLIEDIMGWRGKMILEHDGEGLGGWLKWLREAPRHAGLLEAREKLTASAGGAAPAPARRQLRPPVRPTAPLRRKGKSRIPFLTGGVLLLATISLGGWGLIRWNNARLKVLADSVTMVELEEPAEKAAIPKRAPTATASVTETSVAAVPPTTSRPQPRTPEQIRLEAMEFSVSTQNTEQAKAAMAAHQRAEIAKRKGVFQIDDASLLLDMSGRPVILEGTLGSVERSSKGKGKTFYLLFSGGEGVDRARVGIEVSKARGDTAEAALKELIGRKLRIKGTVRKDRFGSSWVPVVMFDKRSAIQEIP